MTTRDELIALEPRLRQLAARLVSDPVQAEDVLQETYLQALHAHPDSDRGANGWLRRILRSKARQLLRHERRRRRFERRLPDILSDPDSEGHGRRKLLFLQQLAAELEALREPYRSTLRERFLADVPPPELARREGVPVRTIHTRISRGLMLLRDALERRVGRPSWQVLVLPFARLFPRRGRLAAAVVVAAGAVLLVRLPLWPVRAAAREAPRVENGALAAVEEARSPAVALAAAAMPARVEHALTTPVTPELDSSVAAPARPGLAGRVVDLEGRGVADLEVVFETGIMESGPLSRIDLRFVPDGSILGRARSDHDGHFHLALERELESSTRGRVIALGPRHRTVLAELFHGHADAGPLELVVARHAPLDGRVLDAKGDGVHGARLALRPAESFLARQDAQPWSWLPSVLETDSACDGSFRFADAYEMSGVRLQVRAPGFDERLVVLDGERTCEVRLERERCERLNGTLCQASGEPVASGRVVAAGRIVETDDAGRFALDRAGLAPGETILGFAPGHLPARWSYEASAKSVELRVGGPSASISGRVEDERGRPVPGAFVWTIDPTLLGPGLATFFAETHMNVDPRASVPFQVLSDEEGRFELPFLLERSYRLGALERETFIASSSPPIAAGSRDVVLRLQMAAVRTPVFGRVVDRNGAPLPAAKVTVHRPMVQVLDEDGRTLVTSFRGPSRLTDEDGWFGLPPVPEDGCTLDVMAEGCFAATPVLPRGSGRDYVEVVVARRVALEVRWSTREGPLTHFGVVGPTGDRLDVLPADDLDASYGVIERARVPLERGTPALVLVPDSASSIVFFEGEREVVRRALALAPEGTTRVDL